MPYLFASLPFYLISHTQNSRNRQWQLPGPAGISQRLVSPFLLRSPAASANVVLAAAYGPSGSLAKAPVPSAATADRWLHFANGRGEVLGPAALAFKSASRNDQLARSLWRASEAALAAEPDEAPAAKRRKGRK